MRRNKIMLLAVAALVLMIMPACALTNLVAREEPGPAPTPSFTPKPTFTPTAVVTEAPVVAPTFTPTAAPTDTPTPEASPTPAESPTAEPTATAQGARVVINNPTLNVRGGPGTNYGVVGQVRNGERYDVTGKNPAGNWYQINFNGQTGWVSGDFTTVEGDAAAIPVAADIPAPPVAVQPTATARPVVVVQPTPRPQPTAAPQSTAAPVPTTPPAPTAPPAPTYPFSLVQGSYRCDPNAATTYFNGFVRRRDNSLMNGVCVHVAYYGPRNTKCTGCDGVGDGIWGFSPFGGPAPTGTTVEVFVVSCPGSMPPGGQTLETGFGDLTPRSDKWVHTVTTSEQCTGITFVAN